MKQYLLIGLIGILPLYAAPSAPTEIVTTTATQPQKDRELAWVDEQIQAILPARIGVSDGMINALKDPMKLQKPTPKVTAGTPGAPHLLPPPKLGTTAIVLPPKPVEEPLRLQALMNQSALINKKWYKLNETVRNYRLSEIKPNSVLLVGSKEQRLILFLNKPNSNIQITTK